MLLWTQELPLESFPFVAVLGALALARGGGQFPVPCLQARVF